jgi:hypothetical protein
MGANDLKKGLGVARDSISLGRKGTEIGFSIAEKSTKLGFGIARSIITGIGKVAPGLGKVTSGVDGVVGFAQTITEMSQGAAKGLTLASMDLLTNGLDAAGAEKYELARLAIGEEETDACLAVIDAATKVQGAAGLETHTASKLLTGIVAYRQQQAPLRPPGVQVNTSFLARWLWVCAAMYGGLFNHAMGTYLDIQATERDFLATAMEQKGYKLVLDGTIDLPRQMYKPAYAVIVDDTTNTIVVAIRGTANIRDALTDLVCEPLQLAPGELRIGTVHARYVHEGMWRAATRLADELAPTVWKELEERPNHNLLVIGHSLGAGTAGLLTLIWRPLLGDRLTCIGFAMPQTLDDVAARAAENENITSVLLGEDLVPRLSLRSVLDLSSSAAHLGGVFVAESTVAPVEALRPPGKLIHLRETGVAFLADHDDFAKIRVSRRMLLDHLWTPSLRSLGEQVQ